MQEPPSKLEVIKSSGLFSGLTDEQMEDLALVSRPAHAERTELIWLDGSSVTFFGIVASGFVKMTRTTAAGQEVTTEIMGPGQVFGLLGVVDGTGCPQTAKAVCDTWYLKVPKAAIMPIYNTNVVLKEHLVRRTTNRLRQSYDMISHLSSGKVDQRVAAVLMMLANSYGVSKDGGVVISVPLTRQDIAEIAGTTVESTIRVMSKWQKSGLVSTTSKVIFVKDKDALVSTVRGAI